MIAICKTKNDLKINKYLFFILQNYRWAVKYQVAGYLIFMGEKSKT